MRQYDQSQVRENEILSETAPWLFGLLIVECIISKLKRKKVYRLNDTINRYVIMLLICDYSTNSI